MGKKSVISTILLYAALLIGLVIIALPLYLTVVSSLKNTTEIFSNFFGFPKQVTWDNFKLVLGQNDYFVALKNTAVITVCSIAGMVTILPMASYAIARRMGTSKFYSFLYYFMVAGIFVPFQVKMLPIVKLLSTLGLTNQFGAIIFYIANSTCTGIFLMVGYLQSIPRDLEEAACIDGATTNQTFYSIVRPAMTPIIATAVIKDSLWFWNDYFMPSLVLNRSKSLMTLTLYQYSFKSENATNYTIVFAVVLLSIIPIILTYLIFQRKIVSGMMEGAIKG